MSHGNSAAGLNLDKCDPAGIEHLISLVVKANQHRSHRELVSNWAYNSGEALHWSSIASNPSTAPCPMTAIASRSPRSTSTASSLTTSRPSSARSPSPPAMPCSRWRRWRPQRAWISVTPRQRDSWSPTSPVPLPARSPNVRMANMQVNAKNGVIIATGDYPTTTMVDYYIPDLHNFERKQNNQTGDGHKMGMWVGAAMEHVAHQDASRLRCRPGFHVRHAVFGRGGQYRQALRRRDRGDEPAEQLPA